MCTTTDVPATARVARARWGPGLLGCYARSDGSSVLSVPGPQDVPGNPARLTPSYYLLSGENPGSWGVCSHSSTTFLHRVISGALEGFGSGLRSAVPGVDRALDPGLDRRRGRASIATSGRRRPPAPRSTRTGMSRRRSGIRMPTESQCRCLTKVRKFVRRRRHFVDLSFSALMAPTGHMRALAHLSLIHI